MGIILLALRNWKITAIVAAIVLLFSALTAVYVKGRSDANNAAVIFNLKQANALLHKNMKVAADTIKDDALAATKDAKTIAQYESQVNELIDKLEDSARECLTPGDTDRLRSLWKEGLPSTSKSTK